jgi:hypothetical protein
MPLDVTSAPATASPLWIIALFIALSEATAGVAAITTYGATRLIFACFAVAFPVAVFAAFVWLLINHAPKLYAPGQYSKDISPEAYASGIGGSFTKTQIDFVSNAVAQSVVQLAPPDHPESTAAMVEEVARRFEAAAAESSVTVSLGSLKPGADVLQVPVTEKTTVDNLLDAIYFALAPAVRPFTYNKTWVLADENGNEYTEMGSKWAESQNQQGDSRRITEVGIVPGSSLRVIAKGGARRRLSDFDRRLDSLLNDLSTKLRSDGISVENIRGPQRPRLLTRIGTTIYGLYVMPGIPKESEDWVGLARAASAQLGADRGVAITPVLVLDQEPPPYVMKAGAASQVVIMWLEHGTLHGAPWASPESAAAPVT